MNFSLSKHAEIPKGRYNFIDLNFELISPDGNPFSTGIKVNAGSFYDGRRFSFGLNPKWSVHSDLELDISYELNRMIFPERSQELTAHIARLRILYMLSTKFSAMAFIQYNSTIDSVDANFRFRFNPREGVDLYLVYNESLNTDRYRLFPALPFTGSRTVLLKYTYTFNIN